LEAQLRPVLREREFEEFELERAINIVSEVDMDEHSIAHAFHHNAFLVVSNGDKARYGSITSKWEHFVEWKRNSERDQGRVDAEALLEGMLAKDRLLDLVENFIVFDDSRAGGTRKIVARNHHVLGVNNAVESVLRQEELKRRFPPERRTIEYTESWPRSELKQAAESLRGDLRILRPVFEHRARADYNHRVEEPRPRNS
jgi:type I restriction enzyme R subunit